MKRGLLLLALGAAVASAVVAAALVGSLGPSGARASSHREAPLIADDPVADNTDVYAFVSPDKPDTVTIIANYIPLEEPDGGPNFYEFDDNVLYEINIDNNGDARRGRHLPVPVQHRRSRTRTRSSTTPARSTRSTHPNWNVRQTYSVTRVDGPRPRATAPCSRGNVPTPARQHRLRSTPNYDALAKPRSRQLPSGMQGLRRPARRSVLRRPRLDLRPRRACGRSTPLH